MQSLRLFCDVASHRSFSRAAELHGITQSAASQRIGALEKRLGVTLIDRSVRPLDLTDAGKLYFSGCRQILEQYDGLVRQLHGKQPETTAVARVDAIYSAGIDWLQQIKEEFEAAHSHMEVEVHYKRPEQVHDAVREGLCDLGILSYPERWRDVARLALRDEIMVVVCAPGHPLAQRDEIHASQLGEWEMIGFGTDLPAGRRIRAYLRKHGVQPRIVHDFDNIDTIKTAVAVTDRIAILPRRTARREVARGTLVAVALEPELTRPMGVIYRRRSRQDAGFSPAVKAFIDLLLKRTSDGAPSAQTKSAATDKAEVGAET